MESSSSERVELPTAFEEADIEHLAHLIADMLERLMAHNDRIPLSPESLTRFHSRSTPSITVLDYLKRIIRFTNVEKTCLLITLHYIDQICARLPLFTLSSLTCHRFIIAAITVSSKALCDSFCSNNIYARVGGIHVTELNMLEREFLSFIDWRLTCTREVLQEYYVSLVRTHRSGQYVIAGADNSSGNSSSESDIEMDSGVSRPSSPSQWNSEVASSNSDTVVASSPMHESAPSSSAHHSHYPSAILIDPGSNTQSHETVRRPTFEQNVAFAELRRQSSSRDPEWKEGEG